MRASRNSSRRSVASYLDSHRIHLRERRRQSPPVHHPDPVIALAVEPGEVEAHRLVAKVVDRRRARSPISPGCAELRLGWVERVRATRRTPQVTLVVRGIDPTVVPPLRVRPRLPGLNRYASQPNTSRRNRSTSSTSSTFPHDRLPSVRRRPATCSRRRRRRPAPVRHCTSSSVDCGHIPPDVGA